MSNSTTDDARLGRQADTPTHIPKDGWWAVLKRTWNESTKDNISIVAAGVAFLSLLAIFPGLSATISIYGLVADPAQITQHIESLSGVLPGDARDLLIQQLHGVSDSGALGFGLFLSLAIALWSAASGMKSLMLALNIAYDEEEKRGFISFTLAALALTVGFILMLITMIAIVVVVPAVLNFIGLGGTAEWLIRILRWPLLAGFIILALGLLYRFGPCRAKPQWKWATPGAIVATVLWLAGSIAFSVYVSNFADYNATYGSLGAGIILLLWLYLGSYAILLGAEMNAELEHQTMRDTTTGPEKPMGERNAYVADTVPE